MTLPDFADLERAEQTLNIWASALAEADQDQDAGECLRVEGQIMRLRTYFAARGFCTTPTEDE